MAAIVKRSIEISAPPWRVWEILTKPQYTSRWAPEFGAAGPIESDWRLGSLVSWRNEQGEVYVSGRVTDVQPLQVLRFTVRDRNPEMQPTSGSAADDITQTYMLSTRGDRTLLAIAHGDFSKLAKGEELLPAVAAHWERLLAKLKALAEEKD